MRHLHDKRAWDGDKESMRSSWRNEKNLHKEIVRSTWEKTIGSTKKVMRSTVREHGFDTKRAWDIQSKIF